ncbi:MAG TPA: hypothetical protein VD886_13530 [Herpetosiphonaceae bacterium]|nr:hypothetical protein [Herpetosiphonaceae bacterium]
MSSRDYQPQRPRISANHVQGRDPSPLSDAARPARSVSQVPDNPLQFGASLGNRQVQRLLQRDGGAEAPAAAQPELSPNQADLFESLMGELSDEELDGALEAQEAEENAGPAAEGLVQAARIPRLVQRGKPKVDGISSAATPNITLANKLEINKSRKPRLVTMARWKLLKAKHAKRNIRKYAAIRHQNLQNDAGTQDLILLIRLHKLAKLHGKRDRHYAAIEAKSNKKSQTAQNRTELLGEAVATIRMESYLGGGSRLIIGYASGAGIDQLWKNDSKHTYYVVEAKGPGATLKVDRFAVRGVAKGATMVQMSQAWIEDRLPRLRTQHATALDQLLADCGLKVVGGRLVNDPAKHGTYTLAGLVINAKWDEANADVGSGISKRNYQF